MFNKKFYLALFLILVINLNAKVIEDMSSNKVEVSENISKTFASSPPITALLYTFSPETMIGVNYQFLDIEKSFMLKTVQELPVIGGFFGDGRQVNIEKLLSLKPDIVFAWDKTLNSQSNIIKTFKKFNISLIEIKQENLNDTFSAIKLMGEILGKEERARELLEYGHASLRNVKNSVENLNTTNKIKVFFAQSIDGLTTECDGDLQSEIISLAGGINVHKCDITKNTKREKITLEKLYDYDPDIIFVREKSTFDDIILENSKWRNLKAYKNNKIFLVPSSPFAWTSRPPTFMRFLGLPWMHNKIYPDHFKFDEINETKKFYKLFLHVDLSNEDVKKLLIGG